jgi:hypothetical protein
LTSGTTILATDMEETFDPATGVLNYKEKNPYPL